MFDRLTSDQLTQVRDAAALLAQHAQAVGMPHFANRLEVLAADITRELNARQPPAPPP